MIALLLRTLDQAYDKKSWHGPTLRGTLRGVCAEEAAWRPAPGRHNVWELAVHAAYWKYSVARRLEGGERGSFPLAGSNWFPRPEELSEAAWKGDLALLGEMHRRLREAVAALDPEQLETIPPGSKTRVVDLVLGVAAHDLYHAGQVQLLKRLRSR
ncbi:MAG TPA: DinB family protein [Thermoanaerobaculia bacterium]|nr:DinB family protein [Thermoanaerobaculia bacterium]